jgi:hypothetical protein
MSRKKAARGLGQQVNRFEPFVVCPFDAVAHESGTQPLTARVRPNRERTQEPGYPVHFDTRNAHQLFAYFRDGVRLTELVFDPVARETALLDERSHDCEVAGSRRPQNPFA